MRRAAVVACALVACSGSKPDQLIDARRERRALLDTLYGEYGGGALAKELQTSAKTEEQRLAERTSQDGAAAARELLKTVGAAVGEVDRVAFEEQCDRLGAGERPMILNDKAKAFFAQKGVEERCAKVAKLSFKVAELERELGDRAPPK